MRTKLFVGLTALLAVVLGAISLLPLKAVPADQQSKVSSSEVRQNPAEGLPTQPEPMPVGRCGPAIAHFCLNEGEECQFTGTCGKHGCWHYDCVPVSTTICPGADPGPVNACSPPC